MMYGNDTYSSCCFIGHDWRPDGHGGSECVRHGCGAVITPCANFQLKGPRKWWHWLARFFLCLALMAQCGADDALPEWILTGVAYVESRSYWDDTGRLVYVDRRTGSAGEVSPFQITPDCFKTYARSGDSFRRLSYDMDYATSFAVRVLSDLHHKTGSWDRALKRYNGSWAYVRAVRAAGGVQ